MSIDRILTAQMRLDRIMSPYPYHAKALRRRSERVYVLMPRQVEEIREQALQMWPGLVPLVRTETSCEGTCILSVHVRGTVARVRYVAEAY